MLEKNKTKHFITIGKKISDWSKRTIHVDNITELNKHTPNLTIETYLGDFRRIQPYNNVFEGMKDLEREMKEVWI